jgi:hypothetical protein
MEDSMKFAAFLKIFTLLLLVAGVSLSLVSIWYFNVIVFEPELIIDPFGLIVALLFLIPAVVFAPLLWGVALILQKLYSNNLTQPE